MAIKLKTPEPIVRTLYWDDKEGRFVFIVMQKPFVRHHKLHKAIKTVEEAEKVTAGLGL